MNGTYSKDYNLRSTNTTNFFQLDGLQQRLQRDWDWFNEINREDEGKTFSGYEQICFLFDAASMKMAWISFDKWMKLLLFKFEQLIG